MTDLITKKLEETPDLLTIGEVSKLFNIHPDTLRNWEKSGVLVPLRVGPRKDRKYRKQDIETIVAKMGSKLTLAQLEQFLWKSADILRGKIDSSDYKKYIFGLLFYKRISDVWDEEYKRVVDEYKDKTLAEADYNHRFQVPKDCKWEVLTQTSENIGQKLNDIFDKITNVNSPKLDKIFDDLDFANKDRFPNETIQRLVNHFSQYNFGSTYISSDLLGDAYEYLIKQFAADAGKKGGEFYTPREVERIIIGIVKPHQKDHVYDPTVGSGGFLLEAYNYLKDKSNEQVARTLYFYGQEINISTFAIAKINMFLHGLDSSDIRRGDTLANPQFLNNLGNLQTFDIVVANPPYSIKDWEFEQFKNDKYGRTQEYELPPQKNADYAFVLHILKSLNANGRAGIVLPHGVLFRGGSEGRIREQIIKDDLIEAVIALPAKLFYGTGIPAAILIFNRNKADYKKNKILIIDAEKDYLEVKNQNILRKQDIDKIIKTYDQFQNIDGYARVLSIDELKQNNFSLNLRRYLSTSDDDFSFDLHNQLKLLLKHEDDSQMLRNALNTKLEFIDKLVANRKWEIKSLSEIADVIDPRPSHRAPKEVVGGIPFVGIGDISEQGDIDYAKCRKVSPEDIKEQNRLAPFSNNDIGFGRVATVGKVVWLKKQEFEYGISPTMAIIKPTNVDHVYLYYYLSSHNIQGQIKKLTTGSTRVSLGIQLLRTLKVNVPPMEIQKQIADLFSLMEKYKLTVNNIHSNLDLMRYGILYDFLNSK